MNKHRRSTFPSLLLALGLVVALTACESPTAVDDQSNALQSEELTTLTTTLSDELSLTPAQQEDMQATMARHEHRRHEPGFLWYVAADLQERLTDEQKERLFERAAQIEEQGGLFGAGGPAGPGNPGGIHRPNGPQRPSSPLGLIEDLLTEEQRETLAEIHERHRTQAQELREALRNGDLTRERFRAQMQELHEAMREAIADLLTDEQKAELEARIEEKKAEREAQREAFRAQNQAAMAEALELTDAQQAALEELHEQQRAEREALLEQVHDGELTREELQTELEALKDATLAAMEDLLDDVQFEIVQIHHALAVLSPHLPRRRGGPGGGGPGGPGVGGPGAGGPPHGGLGAGGPGPGGPGFGGPGG